MYSAELDRFIIFSWLQWLLKHYQGDPIPKESSRGNGPMGLNRLSLSPSEAAPLVPCQQASGDPETVDVSLDHTASRFALHINFKTLMSGARVKMGSLPVRFLKWHRSHWNGVTKLSPFHAWRKQFTSSQSRLSTPSSSMGKAIGSSPLSIGV
jgi:hypothetical protein